MTKKTNNTEPVEDNFSTQFPEFDPETPYKDKIRLWVMNFKTVYEVRIPYEGKKHFAYFRKPSKSEMLLYYNNIMNSAPTKALEILFNTCLLECDPFVKQNDEAYVSTVLACGSFVSLFNSEVKKN